MSGIRRRTSVLGAVGGILSPAMAPSAAPPPGAETLPDAEWLRGLVERARLEITPHVRHSRELRDVRDQLLSIERLCDTDLECARDLIVTLTASLRHHA